MEKYKNYSGHSGVTHYEITPHAIRVKFKNSLSIYTYSDSKIAKYHIDRMKKLAQEGQGLSTYINQHSEIKENYL